MAGDWVKMRVWLRRDPRVASMADFLAEQRAFMNWLTEPAQSSCDSTAYEYITSDVTRAITVSSLLEIWGVARDRGDREDDDLVIKHCRLGNLDDICATPCMGEAMESVNWASEEESADSKGRRFSSVRLPGFFKETAAPEDRYRQQHAEAQARYRAKNKAESDKKGDGTSDITRDITVTPREEKRREEKKEEKKTGAVALLLARRIPEDLARDFLAIRKAPLTETALEQLMREADGARMTLEQALRECCARGWQGFKAAWVAKPADVVRMTTPGPVGPDPALEKIKADALRAVPPSTETLAKLADLRKPREVH